MTILRAFPILGLLLAVGCSDVLGPDNPRVDFRTDREAYTLGQEGVLSLTNRHIGRLTHGRSLCPMLLERRAEGGWEEVLPPGEQVCVAVVMYLNPGETYTVSFLVLESLYEPGGEYRFGAFLGDESRATGVVKYTNAFTIQGEG